MKQRRRPTAVCRRTLIFSIVIFRLGACAAPSPSGYVQYPQVSAESEYQAALNAYNQALADLQTARTANGINSISRGSLLGAGLGILTQLSVADAERNVEVARQRLLAAQLRIAREGGQSGSTAVTGQPPILMPVDTDVNQVVCYYPPNCWKSFTPGKSRAEGFAAVMYLVSQGTDKGVFADGTFQVDIRDRTGRKVFQTSAPMSALPKRQATVLGNGYQPTVYWGTIDLRNQEITIVLTYISPTGRRVASDPVKLTVPSSP
jgi:hypothetical protein